MSITDVEIIVGTYEEFLLGYKVKKDNKKISLIQSFAEHSHRASVRCVSASGKFLASGSADETVALYDMNSRKHAGNLLQHNGTVSCLSFSPTGSHLLTASEDGEIKVYRTGSWMVEKVFIKAHKGEGVTHLTIHPSGKLALSVGTDATLRTWNLVKGRQAYATNLGKSHTGSGRAVSCIQWSPSGNNYAISVGSELNVYDVSTAGIVYTIQQTKKITCFCFSITRDLEVAVGDEGGGISIFDISQKKGLKSVTAHGSRVKCLKCIAIDEKEYLVSAASSGEIKLWKHKVEKLKEISSINSDCRITCLEVYIRGLTNHVVNEKGKSEANISNNVSRKREIQSKSSRTDTEEIQQTKKWKTVKKTKNEERSTSREIQQTEKLKTVKKAKNKEKNISRALLKSSEFKVICAGSNNWEVEDL